MRPPTDFPANESTAGAGGCPPGRESFARRLMRLRKLLKGVIGAPDYDAYLAHHRAAHPAEPVMSEAEFFRYAIDRRYNKRGGGMRCC